MNLNCFRFECLFNTDYFLNCSELINHRNMRTDYEYKCEIYEKIFFDWSQISHIICFSEKLTLLLDGCSFIKLNVQAFINHFRSFLDLDYENFVVFPLGSLWFWLTCPHWLLTCSTNILSILHCTLNNKADYVEIFMKLYRLSTELIIHININKKYRRFKEFSMPMN